MHMLEFVVCSFTKIIPRLSLKHTLIRFITAHPADEGVDVAVRVGVTPPHPRAAAHPVGQRRRRKGGAGLPVEAAPAPMLGAQVEVAVAVRTVPARMAVTGEYVVSVFSAWKHALSFCHFHV